MGVVIVGKFRPDHPEWSEHLAKLSVGELMERANYRGYVQAYRDAARREAESRRIT